MSFRSVIHTYQKNLTFLPNIFLMICILGYVLWLSMFVDIYDWFVSLFYDTFQQNTRFVVIYMILPFLVLLLHCIQYVIYRSDEDMSEKVLGSCIAFLFVPVVLSFLHELVVDVPVELIEDI